VIFVVESAEKNKSFPEIKPGYNAEFTALHEDERQ